MSNIIKAGGLPIPGLTEGTFFAGMGMPGGSGPVDGNRRQEGVVIDSNRKAELYFAALMKNQLLSDQEEEERKPVLPPEVVAAIKEQAALILNHAKAEEVRILGQALKEAKLQKNQILEDAREQGYKEGYASGAEAIEKLERNMRNRIEQNQLAYEKHVEELEPLFSGLVIQYVEKLTGILMEENRPVVGYLMKEAIRSAEPSKSYTIYVSPEDLEQVRDLEQELQSLVSSRAVLEILPDNGLAQGGCKIETDSCVIDTGLGTRLNVLIENLRLLADGR